MTFKQHSGSSFNVAVQVDRGAIEYISVPKPVYDYIMQLENAVRDETGFVKSKLKEAYPSRFNNF